MLNFQIIQYWIEFHVSWDFVQISKVLRISIHTKDKTLNRVAEIKEL